MSRSFEEALINRRSYYAIKNETPISDLEIEHIVHTAVKHVPSAFNSQSARLVLLLGDNHRKLWGIVKDTLKKMLSSEAYAQSEAKIDGCFSCGYGTVLFFEDDSVVKGLQDAELEELLKWRLYLAVMDVVRKCYKRRDTENFRCYYQKLKQIGKVRTFGESGTEKIRRLVWSVLFRLRVNSNIYAEMIVKMRKLWFSFWW